MIQRLKLQLRQLEISSVDWQTVTQVFVVVPVCGKVARFEHGHVAHQYFRISALGLGQAADGQAADGQAGQQRLPVHGKLRVGLRRHFSTPQILQRTGYLCA